MEPNGTKVAWTLLRATQRFKNGAAAGQALGTWISKVHVHHVQRQWVTAIHASRTHLVQALGKTPLMTRALLGQMVSGKHLTSQAIPLLELAWMMEVGTIIITQIGVMIGAIQKIGKYKR